jgi:hypothetical protein
LISYKIESNYTTRIEKEIIDTFLFALTDIVPVYLEDHNNNTYLKELSFQVKILNEETTFYFQKDYSAEILIKNGITEHNGN